MCLAQGLFIRDTAIRFKTQNLELTRANLNSFTNTNYNNYAGAYNPNNMYNPKDQWKMSMPGGSDPENIDWLLG